MNLAEELLKLHVLFKHLQYSTLRNISSQMKLIKKKNPLFYKTAVVSSNIKLLKNLGDIHFFFFRIKFKRPGSSWQFKRPVSYGTNSIMNILRTLNVLYNTVFNTAYGSGLGFDKK